MTMRQIVPVLAASLALSAPGVAIAQTSTANADGAAATGKATEEAPIYDSPSNTNRPTSARFGSPEDDARPGEYFFGLAVRAIKKKDYPFAVHMYKVAASWAYKPAEYNLGVMYATGTGVSKDMPRAMAWMTLAAERNDKHYVAARNLINSKLDDAHFKQANVIFGKLLPTYGDATALVRAKARWRLVRTSITGSRVGSLAGNLKVGGVAPGQVSAGVSGTPSGALKSVSTNASGVLGGDHNDGAVAYRQLVSSDNPYDPKFEWRPGSGTVTVKPLTPIKKSDADHAGKSDDKSTNDSHPA